MFLKKLLAKPSLIAFYKDENIYRMLHEQYKKNKIIHTEKKEFESKHDLVKYIKEIADDNPQTYVSTFIDSPNQGVVPSCEKHTYKQMGIDYENIKMVCINNKYSFYTTIYEILEIKKEFKFLDFLYSAFTIIDFNSSLKHNVLYVLITKEYSYFLIYYNHIPVFSDIFEIEEEILNEENEIEEISDMDIVEEFEQDLEEIEDIEETSANEDESNETSESPTSIENLNIEYKIIEQIKTALKEYYENGNDFIDKIQILDSVGIDKKTAELVKDEFFIECNVKEIDILKSLNNISRKYV